MIEPRYKGFTLIELLIVIAIIGILAAIAIPQFALYRTKSYNTEAMSDLRNAATAQEAYHAEYKTYAGSYDILNNENLVVKSSGVSLTIGGDDNSYTIIAYHSSGNKTYTLAGPGGRIQGN